MVNIKNPLIDEYLDRLYIPANEEMGKLRAYAEDRYIPIITRDVERFLAVIMASLKPKRVLEIGTAIGYSASFMAIQSCTSIIDTIENNQDVYEVGLRNIQELGLGNQINVFLGDATEIMNHMVHRQETHDSQDYDLVFIDASKSRYKGFFDQALSLVKDGALIICDNVLMRGTVANDCYDPEGKHKTSVKNMRNFLNYISDLEEVETAILPIGDGISMSIKK
jgi:predicted O-methyltransferase YrrM